MTRTYPHFGAAQLLAACTLLAAVVATPGSAAARGGMKWIGLQHDMKVEGIFGRGDRWGQSGNQFLVSFEAAGFGKSSPLGNLAGIEGGATMGYDSAPFRDSDGVLGEMSMIPIDVWVGFPVTLFNWVRGSDSLLMVGFAPGFGTSWLSGYTYLKLKAAARINRGLVAEVQYIWWPGAASTAYGTGEDRSINAASLRGTVYIGRRKGAFSVFTELYTSQREEDVFHTPGQGAAGQAGGNSSPVLYAGVDPFGATKRVAFESFFRLGVGYAF